MAIIPGVTVDFSLSPRIITIPVPGTPVTITIADLQDTLLDIEASETGMAFPYLRDTSGGEALGSGVTVGWTMRLRNAQVKFQGQTVAIANGVATADDPNGKVLTDSAATFITNGVSRGCTVWDETTEAMTVVTEVISETQIRHDMLSGGGRTNWVTNDVYRIYPNIQCTIGGGNLVAVDDVGAEISPITASPNIQVKLTSSSSATNMQTDAIQYASYQNAVWIDESLGHAGTDYPYGTPSSPVNNISDAVLIADTRGFNKLMFMSNATIASGVNLQGFVIEGISKLKCSLNVSSIADVTDAIFINLTVSGTLDYNVFFKDCVLNNLTFVEGDIHGCEIYQELILGGSAGLEIWNSYSGRKGSADPAIINMGGGGRNCAIHGFTGHIKITNMSTYGIVGLQGFGKVTIDSTVSAGMIHILGDWKVIDNHTGTAVVMTNYNVTPGTVSDAVWNEATSDHTTLGTFGEFVSKKILTVAKYIGFK